MRTIIIGAGEVGTNIARHLVMEDQSVVIVDDDQRKLQAVSETLDVQTYLGMGSHPDVLEKVGASNADMVIAVTGSDEVNMVACQMAYSLFSVPKKIARVRHPSYLKFTQGHLFTSENMPIDVIISPELEIADAIVKTLEVPGAFDATQFAYGEISLVGVHIKDTFASAGVPLIDFMENVETDFIIVALSRGDRIIVPRGSDHIEHNDELYFVCRHSDVDTVMSLLGYEYQKRPRNAVIMGGGDIALEVCKRLERSGVYTKVIEKDPKRAHYLTDVLGENVTILLGECMDRNLFVQENMSGADVVLSLTSDDATNIMFSLLAKDIGAKNIVTRINNLDTVSVTDMLGIDKTISPLEITASKILQHIRKGQIHSLHSIHNGRAQVIETQVTKDSPIVGIEIQDIVFPHGVIIGAIFTHTLEVVLPRSETKLHEGDRVIFFTTIDKINELEDLF